MRKVGQHLMADGPFYDCGNVFAHLLAEHLVVYIFVA